MNGVCVRLKAVFSPCSKRHFAQLHERLGRPEVTCVAFATPPVVTGQLAEACDYVTTVVYQVPALPVRSRIE